MTENPYHNLIYEEKTRTDFSIRTKIPKNWEVRGIFTGSPSEFIKKHKPGPGFWGYYPDEYGINRKVLWVMHPRAEPGRKDTNKWVSYWVKIKWGDEEGKSTESIWYIAPVGSIRNGCKSALAF